MNNQQPNKRYLVFCEICSFKKILESDKPEDFVMIKRSSIPGSIPQFDPVTKKTNTSKDKNQNKMCKCPQCGRGAIVKSLPDVYKNTFKKLEEEERKRQQEIEKKKRFEDGKPHERKVDDDFIG